MAAARKRRSGEGASGSAASAEAAKNAVRAMLLIEEEQNEAFLNRAILFVLAPILAAMIAFILAVQGPSTNVAFDAGALLLLLCYHLPTRLRMKRGRGYRPFFKYHSVTLNILVCSFTLLGYSYSSGWVHASRTIVAAGYLLAISLSSLYHDPRLPVYAALMSAIQYSGIVAYAVFGDRVALSPIETFDVPAFSFDVYAFLIGSFAIAGAISAYSCSRFRATLARSLSSEASSRAITELDAQKTYFFSNISHELRTPLTLILSPIETMLARADSLIPEHRSYLEAMRRNSLRLLKLINGLLDFTKMEAGRMILAREKTELLPALELYLSALRPAAEAKDLVLELAAGGCEGLCAFLDRGLFEKAVFNLLSNALKFTGAGGRVRVELRSSGEGFELSVSDTGIGIPPDKLEFVFERFSQIDSSLSRKYEGTGIGLSLAKDIVELHGGSIRASSELGRGSVFTMTLPMGEGDEYSPAEPPRSVMPSLLSDFPQAEELRPEPAAGGTGRPRVLVVDDNRDLRDYLRSVLEGTYEVLTAVDGLEGLRRVREEAPDLVVSDVMMPGLDGFALCAAIKRESSIATVPVILLTARAEHAAKAAGYESGADDYLGKPFSAEELQAKIRVFIGREGMRKRLEALAAELRALNNGLEERVRERTAELEEQFYRSLDSLAYAIEEKDSYTQGHSLRVERYSLLVAEELGLPLAERQELSIAARLHDIGKIGIPERILNKEGPLTAEEFDIIKTHPERGAKILSPLRDIGFVIEVTRKHHERFDGHGYLGCPRDDIPLLASILAVADAFDAMTSTRAYRPAMSFSAALAEIERGSGSQFDPASATALAAAVRSANAVPPAGETLTPTLPRG